MAALLAAGCTSVAPNDAGFESSVWQVTGINGRATPRNDGYRLELTGGRIGGRFGCNQFGGTYALRGGVLIVNDVASTLMGCPEPAMTFEAQGLAILEAPMRISRGDERQLTLSNAAGSIALERMP